MKNPTITSNRNREEILPGLMEEARAIIDRAYDGGNEALPTSQEEKNDFAIENENWVSVDELELTKSLPAIKGEGKILYFKLKPGQKWVKGDDSLTVDKVWHDNTKPSYIVKFRELEEPFEALRGTLVNKMSGYQCVDGPDPEIKRHIINNELKRQTPNESLAEKRKASQRGDEPRIAGEPNQPGSEKKGGDGGAVSDSPVFDHTNSINPGSADEGDSTEETVVEKPLTETEKMLQAIDSLVVRHNDINNAIFKNKNLIKNKGEGPLRLTNVNLLSGYDSDPDKINPQRIDRTAAPILIERLIQQYESLCDEYKKQLADRHDIEKEVKSVIESFLTRASTEEEMRQVFEHINENGDERLKQILHNEKTKQEVRENLMRIGATEGKTRNPFVNNITTENPANERLNRPVNTPTVEINNNIVEPKPTTNPKPVENIKPDIKPVPFDPKKYFSPDTRQPAEQFGGKEIPATRVDSSAAKPVLDTTAPPNDRIKDIRMEDADGAGPNLDSTKSSDDLALASYVDNRINGTAGNRTGSIHMNENHVDGVSYGFAATEPSGVPTPNQPQENNSSPLIENNTTVPALELVKAPEPRRNNNPVVPPVDATTEKTQGEPARLLRVDSQGNSNDVSGTVRVQENNGLSTQHEQFNKQLEALKARVAPTPTEENNSAAIENAKIFAEAPTIGPQQSENLSPTANSNNNISANRVASAETAQPAVRAVNGQQENATTAQTAKEKKQSWLGGVLRSMAHFSGNNYATSNEARRLEELRDKQT